MRETSKTVYGYQNVKRSVSLKRKSSKKDLNVSKQIITYSEKNMFMGMDVHKKFLQIAFNGVVRLNVHLIVCLMYAAILECI